MIPARLNPFCCDRVEALGYRMVPEEWSAFFECWEQNGFRGAVIGPEGAGKTTFLEALIPRLRARGFSPRLLFLNRGQSGWEPVRLGFAGGVSRTDCLLLDGADELSRLNWWRFRLLSRSAGGVIITAHEAGWLPTIRTCRTSPALLFSLVKDLTEHAACPHELERLFHHHRGNLREVFRTLFLRAADLPEQAGFGPG